MNNIEWKDEVICFFDGEQHFLCGDTLEDLQGYTTSFYNAINHSDFQLNEIREGDFIPASELDTEQKYNEVVEVFGLFGFEPCKRHSKYIGMVNNWKGVEIYNGEVCNTNATDGRQLTYHQIIAIGKLKRMMLGSESIERQSSYCRCKQIEFGESKLPKFNVETPMPEVKEPKNHKPVVAQVMVDLMERMEVGIKTYGEALRPNNGRDALQDAYEEALDLACYLKQAMIERDQAND